MNEIKKSDWIYTTINIAVSVLAVVAIGHPEMQLGLYGLLGLLGLALVLGIVIRPSLGANVLIIVIFTNISTILTKRGFPSIIKPLAPIVAVAILIHYQYMGHAPVDRPRTRRIEMFLFLYFAAVALSYLAAADKDAAMNEILDFAKDIIIIYCILFAVRSIVVWEQTAWVAIVTTGFLCMLGTYQVLTGNYSQTFYGLAVVSVQGVFEGGSTSRIAGPINAPNLWGQAVVSVIPLAMYQFLSSKRALTKLVALVALGFMLFETLNTYSRGAYLALVVVMLFLFYERRVSPMTMAVGLVVVAGLVSILPASYIERFQSLSSLSPTNENGIYQDSSFRGRTSEMLTGVEMFSDYPLLGVGTGNYRYNYQRYAQIIGIETRAEQRDPHSLYVQIVAETGALGIVTFIGLFAAVFSGLAHAKRTIANLPIRRAWMPWLNGIQLSITGYLVGSTFLHGAYIRYLWILLALAMAAIQLTDEWAQNFAITAKASTGTTTVKSEHD